MLEHLGTGGCPAPAELVEWQLCNAYGCLPSQLKQEPLANVLPHLICRDVEFRLRAARGR